MSDTGLLHVRVAEALGWLDMVAPNGMWPEDYSGYHPKFAPVIGQKRPVPQYDTDWSATGPLIETYGIKLERYRDPGFYDWHASNEALDPCPPDEAPFTGETPLIAICHLILMLKEAGKL